VVINDSGRSWRGELSLTRYALSGEPLAKETVEVDAEARTVARISLPESVATPTDSTRELLVARLGQQRTISFFAEDTQVDFPPPRYHADVEPVDGGWQVTITAHTILRELALFPDRLDPSATVDDMLVTLLPDESASFRVTTQAIPDPAALVRAPVLRCVNEAGP
jgi:beta-mannosidase